ncbi:MAG: aspartate aminotransferase family protein [Dehalococcoidia bacterium]
MTSGPSQGEGVFDAATIADYQRRALDHVWIQTQQWNDRAKPDGLTILTEGEGVWLKDIHGNRYLDAMSGLWVVGVGHGRKELAEVARRQMEKVAYVNTFAYASLPAIDLATKLAEVTPGSISRIFFVNSGSEAVETALKIARQYHYNSGERRRHKIIARRGSYHGTTMFALSVNNAIYASRAPFEPLVPGVVHVPGVNCYRCPYEKSYPSCDVFCARTIEETIVAEGSETVAAIIAEPISLANANYPPPEEYWPILRRLCDKYGILLIADEVINGFGRTGKWFGVDHYGVVPDMITVAKQIGSGYLPLAAVMAKREVAERFVGGKEETFVHGITFGTHPVACAVGLANLQIIEREDLVGNSARVGDHMLAEARSLMESHPIIGDVRGKGLMVTLELVKDRQSKEPFGDEDDLTHRLSPMLQKRGLLTRAGNMVQMAPPLVANKEEADLIISIVDDALSELEQTLGIV